MDGMVLIAGRGSNGTSADDHQTETSAATGFQIPLDTTLPARFAFQTTNPATNAVTGTVNTPADILANSAQTFVFAFTPTAAIAPTDVRSNFFCANAMAAPVVSGLKPFCSLPPRRRCPTSWPSARP
jgi:hypothetical protein